MINLKKKLNDLRGMMVGLKMETSLLEQDLSKIEVDLFYLDKIQRDLIYNINLLKRDDIISVMSEYQKSVLALKEVRRQILKFRFLRQDLQKSINHKIKQCEYYLNQFEEECRYSNKVLKFKKREL